MGDSSINELRPIQLALFVLSGLLLLGLAVEMIVDVPPEVAKIVFYIDTSICLVLLTDFFVRFAAAKSKLRFLKWGWIDLIASIPAVEALRWGRLFRILRVLRLLVVFRRFREMVTLLLTRRREAGAATVLLYTVVVMSFCSVGILLAETTPDANIRTAEDALWWALTTITTVGYGDLFPVTNAGRMIASVLMISGIGLFGALSGIAASLFVGSGRPDIGSVGSSETVGRSGSRAAEE